MTTLVSFHAHPDDETVLCGGTLYLAARAGHLGYRDSGMLGDPGNTAPNSFHTADRGQAAARLAAVLTEEAADVLTIYDHHGTYDHPDHVQVHQVGVRAAELAGTPQVLEATLCRDRIARMRAHVDPEAADRSRVQGTEEDTIGLTEAELTTRVDVTPVLTIKRAALAAHASQYPEDSFFRQLPDDAFAIGFGTEWYRRRPGPGREAHLADPFTDK